MLQETVEDGKVCLRHPGPAFPDSLVSVDNSSILTPVPPLSPLQQRRLQARRHSTTYCYDFPAVFENALRSMWADHEASGGDRPQVGALVEATELTLDGDLDFRQCDAPLVPVRSWWLCSSSFSTLLTSHGNP